VRHNAAFLTRSEHRAEKKRETPVPRSSSPASSAKTFVAAASERAAAQTSDCSAESSGSASTVAAVSTPSFNLARARRRAQASSKGIGLTPMTEV
jgi:hypothetical protein